MVLTAKPDHPRLWGSGFDDGLVVCMPFDDGVRDLSRLALPFDPYSSTPDSEIVVGELGPCLRCDNTRDSLYQAPAFESFHDTFPGFTVSIVVRVNSLSQDQRAFVVPSGSSGWFFLYMDNASTDCWRYVGNMGGSSESTGTSQSASAAAVDEYQHVIARAIPGGNCFVDVGGVGRVTGTGVSGSARMRIGTALNIGGSSNSTASANQFNGDIADVRMWNYGMPHSMVDALIADPWRQYAAPKRYVFGYDQPGAGPASSPWFFRNNVLRRRAS